jgi:RNA polymerase sigma factor (sigma-70 family)
MRRTRTSAGVRPSPQAPVQKEGIPTDEVLARREDALGFGELYRRHVSAIYRFLYLETSDRVAAEDATSRTFELAWKRRSTYRGAGKYRSWLFSIARRCLAEYFRRSRPISSLPENLQISDTTETTDPEARLLARERERLVCEMLQGLPQEQREILLLRFDGELSYSEIARIVGKREAAVKMAAYRALNSLRARCSDAIRPWRNGRGTGDA